MSSPPSLSVAITRLSALPWLTAARLAWVVLLIVTLVLVIFGIPARTVELAQNANQRALLELGVSVQMYVMYALSLNLGLVLAHLLIAGIIFWRRPDDWLALWVAFALVANGSMAPLASFRLSPEIDVFTRLLINSVVYLSLVTSFFLLYLFPDGRFVPSWTRYLALAWATISFPAIFFPDSSLSLLTLPVLSQVLVLLFLSITGIVAQVYRYVNVSSPLQRQQTKWAVFGLAAAVLGPFVFFLPSMLAPAVGEPGVSNMMYQRVGGSFFTLGFILRMAGLGIAHLGMLLFPLSFAVAILRYRLWDIDILINRAIVYTALTGALATVYFSSVVLLQTFFQAISGQERSALVTVLSTLMIAALFSPLRKRIQSSIDRRFYRRRYDAQKTLANFSETIRNEVDLHVLSSQLQAVIEESMQPAHVSLWLKKDAGNRIAGNGIAGKKGAGKDAS